MTQYETIVAEERLESLADQRDALIVELRGQGLTLQQIGDAVGLTRERVRQICDGEIAEWDVRFVCCEGDCDATVKQIGDYCSAHQPEAIPTDCPICGDPHHAKGLCHRHYLWLIYHARPERREALMRAGRKWRKKNPEKVKAINRRAQRRYQERKAREAKP